MDLHRLELVEVLQLADDIVSHLVYVALNLHRLRIFNDMRLEGEWVLPEQVQGHSLLRVWCLVCGCPVARSTGSRETERADI